MIVFPKHPAVRLDWGGALLAAGATLFMGLILLLVDPNVFWADDYQLEFMPVFEDMARSWSVGEWPLLSPGSWVCGNLAGEYQFGTFSVFINMLVIFAFKLPLSLPLKAAFLSIIHLATLSSGCFLLARETGLKRPLALMAAVMVAFCGIIYYWGATNWFPLMASFVWIPWIWLCWERNRLTGFHWSRVGWAAIFVYLLVAAGWPFTVLMLVVLGFWMTLRSFAERKSRLQVLLPAMSVLLGSALASPSWLMLLLYTQGSARSQGSPILSWSSTCSWHSFLGFITTGAALGKSPWLPLELACGTIPGAMLAGTILARRWTWLERVRWELTLLVGTATLSCLPSISLFRWSFRWLPMVILTLAIICGHLFRAREEEIELKPAASSRRIDTPSVWALLICVAIGLTSWIVQLADGYTRLPDCLISIFILGAWAGLNRSRFVSGSIRKWSLPSLVALNQLLLFFQHPSTPPNKPIFSFTENIRKPAHLASDRIYLSIYPPPQFYLIQSRTGPGFDGPVRPGNTQMHANLRFLNGYSPIEPAGLSQVLGGSSHGDPSRGFCEWVVNHPQAADAFLRAVGVDGLIFSRFNWPQTNRTYLNWECISVDDQAIVFHRPGPPLPRIRPLNNPAGDDSGPSLQITDIDEHRNWVGAQVLNRTSQPQSLVVSRPFFPGYKAFLGSDELPVQSMQKLLPLIQIPPGASGRFRLVYNPDALNTGIFLAAISSLAITACMLSGKFPSRNAE